MSLGKYINGKNCPRKISLGKRSQQENIAINGIRILRPAINEWRPKKSQCDQAQDLAHVKKSMPLGI